MKTLTVKAISEKVGCHIDTLFRIKSRRNRPSAVLAKKLEETLGVDRRRWMWPEDFGDPWEALKKKHD